MDRYWDRLALAVIAGVVLFALLRQCLAPSKSIQDSVGKRHSSLGRIDKSPPQIEGGVSEEQRLYHYILRVIREGSHRFHFPGGEMEGGYLQGEAAKRAACYVMSLSGYHCPEASFQKGGEMYYTSVCGGCHGNDGKGLHGSYPDLTRVPLLGLEEKEK